MRKKYKIPKYCDVCNEKTKSRWNFCPFCGKAFMPMCKICRRPIEGSWKICPYCEHPVSKDDSSLPSSVSEYTCACRGAWMDGVINSCERRILYEMRIRLGLTQKAAHEIEESCAPQKSLQYYGCVEAAAVDGIITSKERHFLDCKIKEFKLDAWAAKEIEKSIMDKE